MGWVSERYRCVANTEKLTSAFNELRDLIRDDVKEANDLCNDVPDRFRLEEGQPTENCFRIIGLPLGRDMGGVSNRFEFQIDRTNRIIRIFRTRPDTTGGDLATITITQRWDANSESCKLYMNGKAVTVDEIRKKAMEPMFF